MLISIFDKLMSGRRIRRIAFTGRDEVISAKGLTVDFHDGDDALADAWVCWDGTGIWLTSNAHTTTAQSGYVGMQYFDEPLANITAVEFMPERRA